MPATFGNTATTPSTVPGTMRVKKYAGEDVIAFPTPPNVQINVGDLVCWNAGGNSNTGCLALMSNVVWDTNLVTTQQDALAVFLGITLGQKNAVDGQTTPIPVVLAGYAGIGCAALLSAATVGAYVAPAGQGVHNLSDFLMAITVTQAAAFGYLFAPAPIGTTELLFYFQSALLFGGLTAP